MLSDSDLRELGVMESDTNLEGMKRYSEFAKFHEALLASKLGVHAKGELFFPGTAILIKEGTYIQLACS